MTDGRDQITVGIDIGTTSVKALAVDGDALNAKAGGNGETLDAGRKGAERALGLAADDGAIGDRAAEEENREK